MDEKHRRRTGNRRNTSTTNPCIPCVNFGVCKRKCSLRRSSDAEHERTLTEKAIARCEKLGHRMSRWKWRTVDKKVSTCRDCEQMVMVSLALEPEETCIMGSAYVDLCTAGGK